LVIKTNQFVLYEAEVAVCFEVDRTQINAVWIECIILQC